MKEPYECKGTRVKAKEIAKILGTKCRVSEEFFNMSGMPEYQIKDWSLWSLFGRELIHIYHENVVVYCRLSEQTRQKLREYCGENGMSICYDA
jgi:hypothetical protein